MMKEMVVKLGIDCVLVCLDDKFIVLIGEFGLLILIGVRVYNKFLISKGVKLLVFDYDFYIYGVVLLVLLDVKLSYFSVKMIGFIMVFFMLL